MNPEYLRKTAVAAQLADKAYLRGGIDAMDTELKSLRRGDADPVIVGEFERLYHRQCMKDLPEQRLAPERTARGRAQRKEPSPQRAAAFDADKAEVYRALQDARAYVTDFDRNGRKAEALYKRLERASRMMRPWSTDGTAAQSSKAIEYLNEITSILSDKIGPASRREFPEQR